MLPYSGIRSSNCVETDCKNTKSTVTGVWPVGIRTFRIKKTEQKAGSHRDLYAPNRLFSHNTAQKYHGRRQPYHGIFSCLAAKSLVLECFAVLKRRFFLTGISRGRRNTVCISRTMDFLWGKRFLQNRINPYGIPPFGRHFLLAQSGIRKIKSKLPVAAWSVPAGRHRYHYFLRRRQCKRIPNSPLPIAFDLYLVE